MYYAGTGPEQYWETSENPLIEPGLTTEQIERMLGEHGLWWHLDRLRQGRNVGSFMGAQDFEGSIREGIPGLEAFLQSLPQYGAGWKKGLMGEVPDVTGADLFQAQDKSLWPELPESPAGAYGVPPGYEGGWSPSAAGGAGFLLDMMDPALAAAPQDHPQNGIAPARGIPRVHREQHLHPCRGQLCHQG